MSKLTLSQIVFGTAVDDLKNFLLDTDLAGAFRIRRKSDGYGATLANFSSTGVLDVPAGLTVGAHRVMRMGDLTPIDIGLAPGSASYTTSAIPDWVKQVVLTFKGVSTNNAASYFVKAIVGGAQVDVGYVTHSLVMASTNTVSQTSATAGIIVFNDSAGDGLWGTLTLTRHDADDWIVQFTADRSNWGLLGVGRVTLSGPLQALRLVTGAGNFDDGQVNGFYIG